MKVLALNPGGTSTKVAVFEDRKQIFKKTIVHPDEEVISFKKVFDEFEYRMNTILKTLENEKIEIESLDAVVGRGGLMKPIPGGVYPVNDTMVEDLRNAINGEHASNLGAPLARSLGERAGAPAYIVDPVSVDEFHTLSRYTGIKDIVKPSWLHALNHKAVCRDVAARMGGKYEDYNFIVSHLGSGVSTAAHEKGKMIDGSGGRSDGPFSPERSGGLPTFQLINLCYSGEYTHKEMVKKVSSTGGFYSYLGTKDAKEVEDRADAGDEQCKEVLAAFFYQVAKEIAMYGATLKGKVDRIIITGGIAYSNWISKEIEDRVGFLAPIEVVPGEEELEALALGAYRVLEGEETPKTYK